MLYTFHKSIEPGNISIFNVLPKVKRSHMHEEENLSLQELQHRNGYLIHVALNLAESCSVCSGPDESRSVRQQKNPHGDVVLQWNHRITCVLYF